MSGFYKLDENNNAVPCDLADWAENFEKIDRTVARDIIGESRISTVFLGLDHRLDDGPPILFETMVFGGPLSGEQERYSTYKEAIDGHAEMVKKVLEKK